MPEPVIDSAVPPGEPAEDRPIPMLRWPDQEDERRVLAARGEPRIVLISEYATPPGRLDNLEVWMLEGADTRDALAAMDQLRRRARERCRPGPRLDDSGLLWFGDRWVAFPDTQVPVIALLVRRIDRLVHNDELRAAYHRAGGRGSVSSFRAVICRIGRRVTEVGLEVQVVRRRGAILTTTPHVRPGRP